MLRRFFLPRIICLFSMFSLLSLPASGQEYRARVQGSVTDPSQAAVAGASKAFPQPGAQGSSGIEAIDDVQNVYTTAVLEE